MILVFKLCWLNLKTWRQLCLKLQQLLCKAGSYFSVAVILFKNWIMLVRVRLRSLCMSIRLWIFGSSRPASVPSTISTHLQLSARTFNYQHARFITKLSTIRAECKDHLNYSFLPYKAASFCRALGCWRLLLSSDVLHNLKNTDNALFYRVWNSRLKSVFSLQL